MAIWRLVVCTLLLETVVDAFVPVVTTTCTPASTTFSLQAAETSSSPTSAVEDYLKENHSLFWNIVMSKNDEVWKKLRESEQSPTMFAPTDDAMEKLGDTKLKQLKDVRNQETVMKMGAFHAVNEPVSAEELFDSGGVLTVLGDVVPVERSISGGVFGIGGNEDGGVTVGGARVVETVTVAGGSFIHRTDDLVSPSILWRYCDQLRIPGSK